MNINSIQVRRIIDAQLHDAGWESNSEKLRYAKGVRPAKGRNMAIVEWPTSNGPADYCLFVGLTLVAVLEAKRKRTDVAGSIEQAKRFSRGFNLNNDGAQLSSRGPWGEYNVPFLFATNGRPFLRQIAEKSGIWFLDARRNLNHPRPLEAWYTPEGLTQLLNQDIGEADEKLAKEPTD